MSKEVTVSVQGLGSECGHLAVSKEAWDWWNNQHEDDLIEYLQAWDDDYNIKVPKEADFLTIDGSKEMWSDVGDDILLKHTWLISAEAASISIDVDGESIFEDDSEPSFEDVVIGDEQDEHGDDVRLTTKWDADDEALLNKFHEAKHIITFDLVSRAEFITYIFEIEDDFEKSKLMFLTEEDWHNNNKDLIVSATYDGTELENETDGDATNKGVYAKLWTMGE